MATKFDSLFSDIEQEEGTQNTSPEVGGKFDSVFSDLESQQNINYNVAVDAALRNDPDRFAQTKQLASEAGVSTDVAERNRDRIEHEVKKSQLDYQALAKKNPILARQLSKLEFAKVAHDDVDALSNIEQTARFLVDGDPAFRKTRFFAGGVGKDTVGRTVSGFGEMQAIRGRTVGRILGDDYYESVSTSYVPGGMPINVSGDISAGSAIKSVGESIKKFFDDKVIPKVKPTKMDQVFAGLGNLSGQIAVTALAPHIAMPSMYAQGVDITAEKIKNDPISAAAPEQLKDAEMIVGGGITAVTEYVSSKLFLKTPQSFAIRNKLLDYAAKTALGASNEAIQETTESLLQDVSHIIFTNPDSQISVKQAVAEGEIAGYVGAIMHTAINSALHIKARKTMSTFERLNEASSAQNLRERSPADYQDYADAVAKHLADTSEGRVSDVYIDSEVFNQIMGEAGIQRDFINEQFPEIVEQLQETDSLGGGDIRLPMNKWIGKVAGTEIGTALTPHIRSTPDALSFAETQQTQDMQDEIEMRSDEIVEEAVTNKQFNDSAREVESTIFEQVKSTQHFPDSVSRNYASFVRDFYVARAKEEGVTPGEIYERYSMNVVASDQISPQQVLNQAVESGYTGDNAIEATEWVRAVEKGLDMSQEARIQRARDMGFDVDQVVYHGTGADFESFDPSLSDSRRGTGTPQGAFVFSNSAENAATYADRNNNLDFIESYGEGGNIKPVFVKFENPLIMEVEGELTADRFFDFIQGKSQNNEDLIGHINDLAGDAKNNGHDAFVVNGVVDSAGGYYTPQQTTFIFDPANIRSINAAFDPDFSDSANLLAQQNIDIESRFFDKLRNDYEQSVAEYAQLPDVGGGKIMSVDEARLLSEDYRADRTLSAPVHEPASEFVKRMYLDRLSEPPQGNEKPVVLFTAGGTGAGKSTTIKALGNELLEESQIIYDTNMNGYESSKLKIEQALEHGKDVQVVMVVRDPIDALVNGALPRAMRQKEKNGTGRTVPLSSHAATHKGVIEAIPRLYDEYSDNNSVDFVFYDNSNGLGNQTEITIDDVKSLDYSDLEERLNGALEDEYQKGKIDQETYEGFAGSQVKSAEQQKDSGRNATNQPGNPRTQLNQNTRGGFDPKSLTAILNKKADYSTFLHESAHFFLEVYSDLAASPNASDQIKQDMQTLLDWFGEPDLNSWNSKTLNERRKAHEQFAYNFELYLFEGKAPSIQMQSVFDRFAAWLRRVYRSIKEELNAAYRAENGEDLPILTGEVRDVMDRMLASEDQIEQAQLVRKSVPMYASQEDSGMSDDEWHAYQSMRQEADDVAVSELSKDSVRQMQWLSGAKSRVLKEMQRKKKRVRKRIRSEVEQDMMSEPVFALMRYLRFGETVDDQGEIVSAEGSTKLNVTEIHELYDGVEDAPDYKALKYGKNGMLSKDGLSPEFVADMFGYPSADALIRKLVDTPSIEDEVSRRTDRRMLEEFAELTDDQSIEKAVNEALHNEARARFVAVELKHVSKSTRPVRVMVQAAKIAAQNILSNKTIDSIKPKQYVAAEARAAKDVLTAMRQGDTAAAANAKQRELLNNQLASEAMKIQEEVEKITNHFRRLSGKGAQNNMRGDYLEQLNNILARFDLRKSATIKQRTDERIPLAEFIKSESDRLSAVVPDLPSWVLADDYKKHYRDLTVGEIRDLSDSVKQIEQLARREENMYRAVRDQTYQQEIESILGELEAVHPDAFDEAGLPIQYRKDRLPFVKDKRMRLRSKFDAEFLNMENLLDVMSAGKGKQIFESVFGRLSKAADDRNEYMKKVGAKINEATAAYTTKERLAMTTKKERVSGTDRYMTREERITVALYYGSADGRQRLTDGNKLTEYEINQIIDSLDAKDVALLKAVWSTSDEIIWPDLRDLNKRTAGIAPKKIPPAPFETRHGTVSGGYVPLVYDGDLDSRALDLNTNATVQELLGGNSGTAATQRSASKERISVVNRPLDLSLRAMAFKINETVHDITHREAIADTYRLLQSKRFSNAIRTIAGPDVYKAMVSRVREVAVKPRTPSGFSEKAFWYLRKNTLVSLMGASFNTVAINVLGAAPAIRRVGSLRFLKALSKFPYHLGPIHKGNKYHDMVIEKSQYMKNRLEGFDRDLNEELSRVLGKQGIMPSLGFWFAGLSAMDRMITMPTWLAAYEKGMELNKNDDAAAVEYADRVIRQTQGSGRPIDLAQVAGGVGTAGEFKRIITMFYNFFSSQLGSIRRGGAIANRKWKDGQKAQAAAQLTLDALMIVVVPATLEAMARGQCGDDPDASDYLYCAGRSSALFTGAFFPIFRDVLPYTWKQFDPDIQSFRVAISPVESALETLARAPKAIADISSGEGTEADQRTLVKGFGYLFGLPGSQAWRTLDGFKALSDGETNDPTVVLTGPRE